MAEYLLAVVNEDGDGIGTYIALADYLAGNKNPSQLLDEINAMIDEVESDEDDEDEDDED